MSKMSLKVVVAGRTYPLTVTEGEQVRVTKAAEDINHAIKTLQENYAVKDMQDLLAMTALQLATKSAPSQVETTKSTDYSSIEIKLNELSADLDKYI
jgi:cell division protein ZapA (FtsZ GTPase activity inhibitor)